MSHKDPSKRKLLFHLALIHQGCSAQQISRELLDLPVRITKREIQLEEICKNNFGTTNGSFSGRDLNAILPASNKVIGKLINFPRFQILKKGELKYSNIFRPDENTKYKIPPIVYVFGNRIYLQNETDPQYKLGIWSENKAAIEVQKDFENESKDRMKEKIFEDGRIIIGALDNHYGEYAFNLAKKRSHVGAIGITNLAVPGETTVSNIPEKSSIISITPPFLELLPYMSIQNCLNQKYSTYSMMKRIAPEIFNPRKRKKLQDDFI
jgi:hypothetical protein